jgi:type IV pilus assembly protein PilM
MQVWNPMFQLGKKKDDSLVGLEIEAGSIAAAEVVANGTTRLSASAIAPLAPGAFRDGEVTDLATVADTLRSLFAEHKLSRRVRLGVANQRVVVRTLRLPAIEDPKELEVAIRSQAHEEIPMPIEQAVLDFRVVGGVPATEGMAPQIDVVVVAARRDMIEASLAPLREAGLEPVGVDLSAFGLIRALGDPAQPIGDDESAAAPTPPDAATLYCNVGDVTNLAIAKGRSCLFTRVSPAGLDGVGANLAAATGLSEEHARMWLSHVGLQGAVEEIEGDPATISQARQALEVGASSVLDEVRLSLDFYGAQEASVPVERVVLGGPGSALTGFSEWMAPVLGLPISVGRPEALSGFDDPIAARLTLPYGLALNL